MATVLPLAEGYRTRRIGPLAPFDPLALAQKKPDLGLQPRRQPFAVQGVAGSDAVSAPVPQEHI